MDNSGSQAGAGMVVLVVIGGIIWAITSIFGGSSVPAPKITISSDKLLFGDYEVIKSDSASKNYEIRIKDSITGIEIDAGEEKACDDKSDFSLTINGEDVSKSTSSYCVYTIKNKDMPDGEKTYEIAATNKSGEDKLTLKITKGAEEETTTTHKYPMTSSGMDLPTASHINCKNYASSYFYPDNATLNNRIGESDNDTQDGDGWIYRPLAQVTSSAGGTKWYQVVCKTDSDGHVTSFSAWE